MRLLEQTRVFLVFSKNTKHTRNFQLLTKNLGSLHLRYQTILLESLQLSNWYQLYWGPNINMSHFAYACKMRYPLNLVLESWKYLWFY